MSDDIPELPHISSDTLERLVVLDDNVITIDGDYHIQLSRCSDYADILAWVSHLNKKNWMHPKIVNRFVELAFQGNGIEAPRLP